MPYNMRIPVEVRNKEKLEEYLRNENDAETTKKLSFLYEVSKGKDLRETAKVYSISAKTGYNWVDRWNKMGYDGIKNKSSSKGSRYKLDRATKDKLKEILKGRTYWFLEEIQKLVENEFKVKYSANIMIELLQKMGMQFSRPYPSDFDEPPVQYRIINTNLEEVKEHLKNEESNLVILCSFSWSKPPHKRWQAK